ncbi:hypothetical protein ES702_05887 [subsurface metagenome]
MAIEIPIDVEQEDCQKNGLYRLEYSTRWKVPFIDVKTKIEQQVKSDKFIVENIYEKDGKINVICRVTTEGTPFLLVFGIIAAASAGLLWLIGIQLDRVYKIIETPAGTILTVSLLIFGIIIGLKALK